MAFGGVAVDVGAAGAASALAATVDMMRCCGTDTLDEAGLRGQVWRIALDTFPVDRKVWSIELYS